MRRGRAILTSISTQRDASDEECDLPMAQRLWHYIARRKLSNTNDDNEHRVVVAQVCLRFLLESISASSAQIEAITLLRDDFDLGQFVLRDPSDPPS